MRIFDPKNQFGSSLLSSADTQRSSVKLEKQIAEGSAVTLTSADISDIENWELSNASLLIEGQTYNFLPDTSRDAEGNLVIDFGTEFSKATLVLKRTVFDGMRQEEEEITIEVRIKRLMAKTMTAATAPTPRTQGQIDANIAEWKALGKEANDTDPVKYPYAACKTQDDLDGSLFDRSATVIGSDVCLISLDTVNNGSSGTRTFPNVQNFGADLPSLKNGSNMFSMQAGLQTFTGEIPNLTNANGMFQLCFGLTSFSTPSGALPNSLTDASNMFYYCMGLTSWSVELPNSITDARYMFNGCSGLTSWSVELPNSITDARLMFFGCTGLTSWNVALPNSLENATQMFQGCSGLKSFSTPSGTLPNSLQIASSMFQGCSGLTSWSVELPNSITGVSQMFYGCSGLKSFSTPSGTLPNSLTIASHMFYGCTGLTSWSVALPNSLQTAYDMFSGCTGLTSWNVALPNSLRTAYDMFNGCKLDKESVEKIADTIPDVSSGLHEITIGYDGTKITDAEATAFENTIAGKGWTVTMQKN